MFGYFFLFILKLKYEEIFLYTVAQHRPGNFEETACWFMQLSQHLMPGTSGFWLNLMRRLFLKIWMCYWQVKPNYFISWTMAANLVFCCRIVYKFSYSSSCTIDPIGVWRTSFYSVPESLFPLICFWPSYCKIPEECNIVWLAIRQNSIQ